MSWKTTISAFAAGVLRKLQLRWFRVQAELWYTMQRYNNTDLAASHAPPPGHCHHSKPWTESPGYTCNTRWRRVKLSFSLALRPRFGTQQEKERGEYNYGLVRVWVRTTIVHHHYIYMWGRRIRVIDCSSTNARNGLSVPPSYLSENLWQHMHTNTSLGVADQTNTHAAAHVDYPFSEAPGDSYEWWYWII